MIVRPRVLLCLALVSFIAGRAHSQVPSSPIHGENGSMQRALIQQQLMRATGLPYHNGETLFCSDCHTMHASMQHAGDPDGSVSPPVSYPWETTPAKTLLKAANPVDLCLTCHDNVANIPDVVNGDINGLTERSAGFFGDPEVASINGHTLGRSLSTDPGDLCTRCHDGNEWTAEVSCVDCHDPHGNGNPRNLQWASDPEGTPPLGLLNPDPAPAGMGKYERANTRFGTLNSIMLREPTTLCIDCHHVFSGRFYTDRNNNGIHERHPSYDSERSGRTHINDGLARGHTDPAHWTAGIGSGFDVARVRFVVDGATTYAAAGDINPVTAGVFCLSCHKAHGSDQAFAMAWTLDNPPDATACDQCHFVAQE